MKENTVFHCGNDEVKYSCFNKPGGLSKGQKRGKKYFLRETVRGQFRSRVRKLTATQVDEFFALPNLASALDWCSERMAEPVKMFNVVFEPRTIHDAIPAS